MVLFVAEERRVHACVLRPSCVCFFKKAGLALLCLLVSAVAGFSKESFSLS